MVQLLEIEAQTSEEIRTPAPQEQRSGPRTILLVVLGVICVSTVLVWPVAPTALATVARIASKSLRPAAHQDPMVQFTPGFKLLSSQRMSSSQPRLRLPTQQSTFPKPAAPTKPRIARQSLKVSPKMAATFDGGDSGIGGASWDAAIFNRQPGESEIKTFLTQRALQTELELLHIARDEVTANWLEAWKGHEGIRNYNGLHGLHMGGRAYLVELLRTPNEEVTVAYKKSGNRMGTKGNPYLEDQNSVVEFTETIETRRLADRLLQLRKEIAEEWVEDLKLIGKENDELWRSFFETVRETEDKHKAIQMPVFPLYRASDDRHHDTAFRRTNYDLLRRLATWDAAKQIRFEYQRGNKEDRVKGDFLDTMLTVYGTDFEGDSEHVDVDTKFFEALLARPPTIIADVPLSPLGIVEKICEVRKQIADKWVIEMEEVPQDQMSLQVELLEASFH